MNYFFYYRIPLICIVLLFFTSIGSAQSFDITYKTPSILGEITDASISEASGLATSYITEDAFWLHNDSGDGPNIWLIDKTGKKLTHGVVKKKNGNNASSRDWEDIASFVVDGKPYLIIGNFGDNPINKSEYYLYILEEPEYDPQNTSNNSYEILKTITFQYENGSQNCESIGVDVENKQIILVSKSESGGNRMVYEIPLSVTSDDITTTAKMIGQFPIEGTTAMDISNDGQHAVVLTYKDAYEFTRYEGTTWEDAFKKTPRQITMPQRNGGEAIAYGRNAIDLYLVREGKKSPVWLVEGEVEQGALFQVDMRLQNDIYNKQVWLTIQGVENNTLMTDNDEDGIYTAKVDLALESNYEYSFSYQNGENSESDIVKEPQPTDCSNENGFRQVYIGKQNLLLKKVIFGDCNESPNFYTIDKCESVSGWKNKGLVLNSTDKKEGNASVEFTGSANVEFEKVLVEPTHANGTEEGTVLEFWYYISDLSHFNDQNQVEISSAGKADKDEYNWSLDKSNLEVGWNFLELKISEASKTGNPDLSAINYFRLYRSKSGEVTTRIDDIKLIGENNTRDSDASLSSISIDYGTFQETFSSGILTYTVEVPFGIETPPTISAIASQSQKATVTIQQATTITEKTSIIVVAADGETERTYTVNFISSEGAYLDECEEKTGWNPGILKLNGNDHKQGQYCLEYEGSDNLEFSKKLSTPHDASGTVENVKLSFWYYVSDLSLLEDANQVEITSSGKPDEDEYGWNLDKNELKNGWNYIQLNVGEAIKIGNPDLNAINFFRIYRKKKGAVTARIDAINLFGAKAQSSDANLSNIILDNGELSPSFSPTELNYSVELPSDETVIPTVSATANNAENTTLAITQATELEGSATILVTAEDGTTQTYTISFSLKEEEGNTDDPISSIQENINLNIKLFPNPFNNNVNFELNANNTQQMNILFYNVSGQVALTQSVRIKSGHNKFNIETSQLQKGQYIVHFIGETTYNVIKLMK